MRPRRQCSCGFGFKFSFTPMDHCGGLKFWKNGKVGAEKFGQFFVQILNQLMILALALAPAFRIRRLFPRFTPF